MPGPATRHLLQQSLFQQVSSVLSPYHQQTKNLLVSYSTQKLGFF